MTTIFTRSELIERIVLTQCPKGDDQEFIDWLNEGVRTEMQKKTLDELSAFVSKECGLKTESIGGGNFIMIIN